MFGHSKAIGALYNLLSYQCSGTFWIQFLFVQAGWCGALVLFFGYLLSLFSSLTIAEVLMLHPESQTMGTLCERILGKDARIRVEFVVNAEIFVYCVAGLIALSKNVQALIFPDYSIQTVIIISIVSLLPVLFFKRIQKLSLLSLIGLSSCFVVLAFLITLGIEGDKNTNTSFSNPSSKTSFSENSIDLLSSLGYGLIAYSCTSMVPSTMFVLRECLISDSLPTSPLIADASNENSNHDIQENSETSLQISSKSRGTTTTTNQDLSLIPQVLNTTRLCIFTSQTIALSLNIILASFCYALYGTDSKDVVTLNFHGIYRVISSSFLILNNYSTFALMVWPISESFKYPVTSCLEMCKVQELNERHVRISSRLVVIVFAILFAMLLPSVSGILGLFAPCLAGVTMFLVPMLIVMELTASGETRSVFLATRVWNVVGPIGMAMAVIGTVSVVLIEIKGD